MLISKLDKVIKSFGDKVILDKNKNLENKYNNLLEELKICSINE